MTQIEKTNLYCKQCKSVAIAAGNRVLCTRTSLAPKFSKTCDNYEYEQAKFEERRTSLLKYYEKKSRRSDEFIILPSVSESESIKLLSEMGVKHSPLRFGLIHSLSFLLIVFAFFINPVPSIFLLFIPTIGGGLYFGYKLDFFRTPAMVFSKNGLWVRNFLIEETIRWDEMVAVSCQYNNTESDKKEDSKIKIIRIDTLSGYKELSLLVGFEKKTPELINLIESYRQKYSKI